MVSRLQFPLRFVMTAAFAAASLPAAAQVAAPALKVGDTWTYRAIDNFNKQETGTWTHEVTSAGPGGIRITMRSGAKTIEDVYSAPGALASGVLNDRAQGSMEPAFQLAPFPLVEGKRWSQKVLRTDPVTKERREMEVVGRVRGWETVKVPAGEFKAIRIERTMYLGDYDVFRSITMRAETEWYAPELKGPVKVVVFEGFCEKRFGCPPSFPMPGERSTYELTSYRAN